VGGESGQVADLPLVEAALAAREGEQGVDEAFLVFGRGEDLGAGGAQAVDVVIGLGQRDLDHGALKREWGT
jgi:hypothetical protein